MMNKVLVCAVCAAVALVSRAERQELSRYQSIIDRQMFGPLPDGFDPTKPPSEVQKTGGKAQKELTKEQEQIRKSVRFSMINLNPKGETMVGFTDSSDPKNVRNYYLKVGESRDGWEVKSADAVAATVSISKDGVDLDLELGGSSNGGSAASKNATASGGGSVNRLRGATASSGGSLGGRSLGRPSAFGGGGLGTLRERRMAKLQQREESEAAAAADKAKREEEAAAEKERNEEEKAQREAEREQQRQQLMQIQEELKKAREARQAAEAAEKESDDSSATADE